MSDSLIEQLQKSAEKALKSSSLSEGIQHLAKAFSLFSKEAKQIKANYNTLKQQFKLTNNKLNSVSLHLKTLLKNINQAIVFINKDQIITLYNDAAEKILQEKQTTVLFQPFYNHFNDNFFGFSISSALEYGLPQKLRYLTLKDKNSQIREVELNINFVYEGPKEHQGIIIIMNDITEKNELQLIANRNNRMKEIGEISANVAHEIRNPLGGIRGYATLLYRDLNHNTELQKMAEEIIEGTKLLERFVTTILQYSKPIRVITEVEDIVKIVKNLKKHIEIDPICPDNIEVEIHFSNDSLYVPIDKDAIKRAFLNLLVNSYQAMREGGKIIISVLKRDLSCVISLSDTGCGIPDNSINKIFSPFFTTKQKGNGLGLAEVQKIIDAHNGKIDVNSRLNYGTTFTITLPLRR